MNAAPQFGIGIIELLIGAACLAIPVIVIFAIVTTKSRRDDER